MTIAQNCFFCVVLLFSASALHANETDPPTTRSALTLFYCGSRHSEIEPCGCKTKQQGGVQYEAALYGPEVAAPFDRLRATLRVDAGEWAHPNIMSLPVLSLKTSFLLRAMHGLNYDAINVSFPEANLSPDYYANLKEQYPDLYDSLVSANVFAKAAPEQPAFRASRIVTRKLADSREIKIGITGAASIEGRMGLPVPGKKDANASHRGTGGTKGQADRTDQSNETNGSEMKQIETAHFVFREPAACLGPVVDDLRGQVDCLILLFAGDSAACTRLAQRFPQLDCIVWTDPRGGAKGKFSQVVNGVTILAVQNAQGKEIGRARFARDTAGHWAPVEAPESLYVTKELPADPVMLALIEEYKTETRKLTVLPPKDATAIYAGAGRCAQCHRSIHQEWQDGPSEGGASHAKAYQTLVDRNQHFNPECLPCHTTGFRQANGFYAATDPGSRFVEGVQCEVCHGPAAEHVTMQKKLATGAEKWMPAAKFQELKAEAQAALPKKSVPKEICLQCHTPERDDQFDYKQKAAKINHHAGR